MCLPFFMGWFFSPFCSIFISPCRRRMGLFGQGRGSLNKICATVSGLVCSYSSQKDLISQQEGCLKGGRPLLCLHGDVPKASTEREFHWHHSTSGFVVLFFLFFQQKGVKWRSWRERRQRKWRASGTSGKWPRDIRANDSQPLVCSYCKMPEHVVHFLCQLWDIYFIFFWLLWILFFFFLVQLRSLIPSWTVPLSLLVIFSSESTDSLP